VELRCRQPQGLSGQRAGRIPEPAWFEPDRITREVFELVEQHFPDHPGSLASFQWPVTREQALQALALHRCAPAARFGPQQDAMWTDTPWGWHALLATSLNLHLLDPREVIAAAETAYRERGWTCPVWKASSGRSWAGASSSAACTGWTCRR
jgi:deoxyribodipyrimidine photolyase-related protein